MLEKCPECELMVSDKAMTCPHCGYPLKNISSSTQRRKQTKRRRLPNGFGQISEIKNQNLRKPFRAMITVGKTETGRPICKPLRPESYFESYNDAYAALVEYHKNPYDLEATITMEELYERWTASYFPQLAGDSSRRTIRSAWARCEPLYKMRVNDVRVRHIKGCIESVDASPQTKARMKSTLNSLLDFAVEYELVDQNYARAFTVSKNISNGIAESTKGHIAFTDQEMDILWRNVTMRYVPLILIECYSGWRPDELCTLLRENVDMKNWTFTGGMKTLSGKNRIVPIHSRIRDLVLAEYKRSEQINSPYLFIRQETQQTSDGIMLSYNRYRKGFVDIRDALGLNPEHRPHDCRVQFITMAKKYNVDEYALKYVVGHAISDITEAVYTKRDPSWYASEIEKIK